MLSKYEVSCKAQLMNLTLSKSPMHHCWSVVGSDENVSTFLDWLLRDEQFSFVEKGFIERKYFIDTFAVFRIGA